MSNVKKMLLTTLLSMPAISLFSALGTTPDSLPSASSDQALEKARDAEPSTSMNTNNASETNAEEQHVKDLMNFPTEPSKSTTAEQRQKMHDDKVQHVNDLMNMDLSTEPITEKAPAKTEEPAVSDHALDRRAVADHPQEQAQEPSVHKEIEAAQDLHSSQVAHSEPAKLEVVHTAAQELGSKIASSESVTPVTVKELEWIHSVNNQNHKNILALHKTIGAISILLEKMSENINKAIKDINFHLELFKI